MKRSKHTPWVIGLTGPILSGKSTALAYFKQAGAGVVSCDDIVRSLYTRPAVRKQIQAALGTADKEEVSALVFNNPAARQALEQILHPLVWREARKQLKQCPQQVVVWEVPLLFEAGWEKRTDVTLAVLADPKTLSARLKARRMTRAEYDRRLQYQLPPLEKAARADVVFYHTNKAQLRQSVRRFYQVFQDLHKQV